MFWENKATGGHKSLVNPNFTYGTKSCVLSVLNTGGNLIGHSMLVLEYRATSTLNPNSEVNVLIQADIQACEFSQIFESDINTMVVNEVRLYYFENGTNTFDYKKGRENNLDYTKYKSLSRNIDVEKAKKIFESVKEDYEKTQKACKTAKMDDFIPFSFAPQMSSKKNPYNCTKWVKKHLSKADIEIGKKGLVDKPKLLVKNNPFSNQNKKNNSNNHENKNDTCMCLLM